MNLEEIINARRNEVKKASTTPKRPNSARGKSPSPSANVYAEF